MKKVLSLLLAVGLLFGCSGGGNKVEELTKDAKDDKEAFTLIWNYNVENVKSYKITQTFKNDDGDIEQMQSQTAWLSEKNHPNHYLEGYMPGGAMRIELITDELQQAAYPSMETGATVRFTPINVDVASFGNTLLSSDWTKNITKVEKVDSQTYKVYRESQRDVYGDDFDESTGQPVVDHTEPVYYYSEITFGEDGLIQKEIQYETDKDWKKLKESVPGEMVYEEVNQDVDSEKIINDFKALEGQQEAKVLRHGKF